MRKLVFVLLLFVLAVTFAKNPITVKFQESPESMEVAGLLELLDASQVTATLYSDSLDARHYEIWMVEHKDGNVNRTRVGYRLIEPDSTKLTFTAIAKDSLNAYISIVYINGAKQRETVSLSTTHHMLIGCDYEWNFNENDTIPLVSYATGIPMKYTLGNGEVVDAFHVCGLRYSKIHPSRWKDEYNLSDYLYFEAIPVKEMSL